MTTARRLRTYSYAQYLQALEDSRIKLEFFEGEILALPAGTPTHAALGARVLFLLQRGLPKRCTAFSSDLKILIERADLATFPDAAVVCGPRVHAPRDANALVNPTLIVEVTAPSTESYDRAENLRSYQQLPSVKAVMLVSHRACRVTIVSRVAGGWHEADFRGGERVTLTEPPVEFAVDELYDGVSLEA